MIAASPIVENGIYLRSLSLSDATPIYCAWLSDPVITQYLESRFSEAPTVFQLKGFIEQMMVSEDSLLLGIFLVADNRHIGNIKLGPIDWNHYTGDIGLLIGDKSQWGKGYASLAIKLLAQYAFEELKLAKLTAGSYEQNKGSVSAFLKAGFAQEGIRKDQWLVDGRRQDGILLGKVNPILLAPV